MRPERQKANQESDAAGVHHEDQGGTLNADGLVEEAVPLVELLCGGEQCEEVLAGRLGEGDEAWEEDKLLRELVTGDVANVLFLASSIGVVWGALLAAASRLCFF